MKIGITGTRDKVLLLINELEHISSCHVVGCVLPECIQYCGPRAKFTAYVHILEAYLDFDIVRQSKYRSLEICFYSLGAHGNCKNYVKHAGKSVISPYSL